MAKSLTAPLAIIKVGGVAIGKMKSIRATENVRRQEIVGIGRITAQELATTGWDGSLNCSSFLIDLRQPLIPGSMQRVAQTVSEWENTLILEEDGVQIDIIRKVALAKDPVSGLITPGFEIFASIKGCFLTREGWDITEMNISGRDVDFKYLTPILYPL